MPRHIGLALTCCVLLAAACSEVTPVARPRSLASPTTVAATATLPSSVSASRAYLIDVLDLIEREALYRDRIDWPRARREALELADGARTPAETYPAIRAVLVQLADRHSNLRSPELAAQRRGMDDGPLPQGAPLAGGIGYLALPELSGSDTLAERYIASARAIVVAGARGSTCGWVVDLRRNGGGNMWPMLVAIGPLLGEGGAGAFVYPDGRHPAWVYRDGRATLGGEELACGPALLLGSPPPVAILTDRYTASSGEAIAIAFRGRPGTRSFGEPTAGVPTANLGVPLPDGALLFLTVARMADRTGRAYEGPLVPDEPIEGFFTYAEDPTRDTVLRAALAWLKAQPGCG